MTQYKTVKLTMVMFYDVADDDSDSFDEYNGGFTDEKIVAHEREQLADHDTLSDLIAEARQPYRFKVEVAGPHEQLANHAEELPEYVE